MTSLNFEPLRSRYPLLVELGSLAEQYIHLDPSSALVKLRTFGEHITREIHHTLQLLEQSQIEERNHFELLTELSFEREVPQTILGKLHHIRKLGNDAVHRNLGTQFSAMDGLQLAVEIGQWFHLTYGNGAAHEWQPFRAPAENRSIKSEAERELLNKLSTKEEQLQQLSRTVDQLRKSTEKQGLDSSGRQEFRQAGQKNLDTLKFDEATTRARLIDLQLAESGWKLAPNGGDSDEVSRESDVPQPNGKTGRADYVLWDESGKPIGVIEAKKTASSPEIGKTQAKLYADGLEEKYGQRPIIFYTNGFEIWLWDDLSYPPRLLFSFHSRDSLKYLIQQRKIRQSLENPQPSSEIVGQKRLFQIEAIQRTCERFHRRHRKALIVQATGTGKTRVAVALCEVLMRANWARRILFLCDRRELRKQAKITFDNFLKEPSTYVTAGTAKDRDKRVYVATYPAMLKIHETFDPGFFDLIIADESHRSIYRRYGALFRWFDGLQLGLTATPLGRINRNTFRLFDCEPEKPTFHYPYEQAVEDRNLAPFKLYSHSTKFMREGVKYSKLSAQQIEELEESGEDPASFDYDAVDIDRKIINLETNREIIRNLMENGIRGSDGQTLGKSIIFARNHEHAVRLNHLFDELYPQYRGEFCQVIDYQNSRAEQLIDDFKTPDHPLRIAISVDMLDTGIDVPEVVNLVFAKPVFSWVKFWQMIGRGTRLCKDLFGPGKDKSHFAIFDHWENFEYFEEKPEEVDSTPARSTMQQLFEARIHLAETALANSDTETFQATIGLLQADINALPEKSINVRERWRELNTVKTAGVLEQFAPNTVVLLREAIAPLMQWIPLHDHIEAYGFDLILTEAQSDLLKGSARFMDCRDKVLNRLEALPGHLNQVRARAETIRKVRSPSFWEAPRVSALEEIRRELRSIIKYTESEVPPRPEIREIDITDGDVRFLRKETTIRSNDMTLYRREVEDTLKQLFMDNPTLLKIRRGESVSESDLEALVSLVLTQNPNVDLNLLREFYPDSAQPLDYIIRTIVGMDSEAVKERFVEFARRYANRPEQTQFLRLLQNHIEKYGSITLEKLYEAPFTSINSDGPDGLFSQDSQVEALIQIIETFQPEELTSP